MDETISNNSPNSTFDTDFLYVYKWMEEQITHLRYYPEKQGPGPFLDYDATHDEMLIRLLDVFPKPLASLEDDNVETSDNDEGSGFAVQEEDETRDVTLDEVEDGEMEWQPSASSSPIIDREWVFDLYFGSRLEMDLSVDTVNHLVDVVDRFRSEDNDVEQ
jgi:hypothetical protein